MSDWIALQARAADLYDRVLPALTDWDAATPCSEWTTREVLAHVVDEQLWIPGLLAGGTVDEVAEDLSDRLRRLRDATGPELVDEWAALRDPVAASWRGTSDDDEVHLSYGTAPAGHYLAQQTFDLAVHAWDLAVSQGVDLRWDADLARAVDEFVRTDLAENPAPELFDPPVALDATADGNSAGGEPDSQDSALARTGRDPRAWRGGTR